MKNLKEFRKLNKLKIKDVSDFLCIPYETYRNYERNELEPSIKILIKLCNLYHVSLDKLVNMNINNEIIDLKRKELNLLINSLNFENTKKLYSFIIDLLEHDI